AATPVRVSVGRRAATDSRAGLFGGPGDRSTGRHGLEHAGGRLWDDGPATPTAAVPACSSSRDDLGKHGHLLAEGDPRATGVELEVPGLPGEPESRIWGLCAAAWIGK